MPKLDVFRYLDMQNMMWVGGCVECVGQKREVLTDGRIPTSQASLALRFLRYELEEGLRAVYIATHNMR